MNPANNTYRYCFILNCSRKPDTVKKKFKRLLPTIDELFNYYEVVETYSKQEAKDYIHKEIKNFDVFISCGGDGTLQLVASELVGSDKVVGILPFGTGNDFAKLFGRNLTSREFLGIIRNGKPTKFDLIQINNQYYCINTFGIGFDGDANAIASELKVPIGKIKYIISALKALFNLSPFELIIKKDLDPPSKYYSYMAVITNGKWEGGSFFISPHSDPTDGVIEITISVSKYKYKLLIQIVRLILGLKLSSNEFKRFSFQSAKIEVNRKLISHSDGEVKTPKSEFSFDVLPGVVTILTP